MAFFAIPMLLRIVGLAVVIAVTVSVAVALNDGEHGVAKRAPAHRSLAAQVASAQAFPARPGPHSVDPSTIKDKGTFTGSDGRKHAILEASTNDHLNQCVVTIDQDSSSVACSKSRFVDSPVQFIESGSSGPNGTHAKEWQLTGVAAPQWRTSRWRTPSDAAARQS
jgi:hypothetical protein